MSTEQGAGALIRREAEKAEIIAGLRHALDSSYRRFVESARADWERLFGSDPADVCVCVSVSVAVDEGAVRGSGFLKSRRPAAHKLGKRLPGFAH